MYLFIKKNMSWHINIIILKTMQQTRTFFCVCPPFFFSCDLNTPSKLSPPTERTFFLEAALWHFPSSVFKFFSALHPVFFFPVFRLFSFLSVFLWQPSFIWAVLRYLPHCLLLSPLPLLCTLLPLPFLFPAFFSLTPRVCTLTGTEKTFELTPVAAISVHLLAGDGVELQVTGPITFSVPLPPDSGLKENDHLPTWRFDPRLGMY